MCPPILHINDSYLQLYLGNRRNYQLEPGLIRTRYSREIVRELPFSIFLKIRTIYHPSRCTFINPAVSL